MDIQFKCYHFNDKFMNTNWPNHVSVMINNQNVPIPVVSICFQNILSSVGILKSVLVPQPYVLHFSFNLHFILS